MRQLEQRLARCHPTNRERVKADLARARNGEGDTVFDWPVEIIRDHGAGGGQAEDNVELVLD